MQLQELVLPLTAVVAEKTDEEEVFLLLNMFDVVVPVPTPVEEVEKWVRFMVGNADAVLVAALEVAAAANCAGLNPDVPPFATLTSETAPPAVCVA